MCILAQLKNMVPDYWHHDYLEGAKARQLLRLYKICTDKTAEDGLMAPNCKVYKETSHHEWKLTQRIAGLEPRTSAKGIHSL